MNPPRVFVSYSHDSASHKAWVLDFATTLVNRGVDAVLDQWDLRPGDDLPEFMEKNLASADYAIMVCTRRYVEKANSGVGGVGYEKMIMTAASLTQISNNNVIPIIREKGTPLTPTFLGTKLYIDFSDDTDIEFSLDELLRVLLNAPLFEKPEVGNSPFRELESARPDRTSDGLKNLMTDLADSYDKTSLSFVTLRDLNNRSSMRRLTLDKYLEIAQTEGMVEIKISSGQKFITVTDKGKTYLAEHEILDA